MKNNIKTVRESLNMTQKDCADRLGVTLRAWQTYEQGVSEPKNELLCKIADMFDVSIDYLLGRTDVKAVNTLTEDEPTEEEIKELEAQIGEAYEKMSIETRRACVQVLMQIVGSVFWEDTGDEAEEETEDKAKAL